MNIDREILNEFDQKIMKKNINYPLSMTKFNTTTNKLTLHKAISLNDILPKAIKV